jgi:hypothetical protein
MATEYDEFESDCLEHSTVDVSDVEDEGKKNGREDDGDNRHPHSLKVNENHEGLWETNVLDHAIMVEEDSSNSCKTKLSDEEVSDLSVIEKNGSRFEAQEHLEIGEDGGCVSNKTSLWKKKISVESSTESAGADCRLERDGASDSDVNESINMVEIIEISSQGSNNACTTEAVAQPSHTHCLENAIECHETSCEQEITLDETKKNSGMTTDLEDLCSSNNLLNKGTSESSDDVTQTMEISLQSVTPTGSLDGVNSTEWSEKQGSATDEQSTPPKENATTTESITYLNSTLEEFGHRVTPLQEEPKQPPQIDSDGLDLTILSQLPPSLRSEARLAMAIREKRQKRNRSNKNTDSRLYQWLSTSTSTKKRPLASPLLPAVSTKKQKRSIDDFFMGGA